MTTKTKHDRPAKHWWKIANSNGETVDEYEGTRAQAQDRLRTLRAHRSNETLTLSRDWS